MKTIILFLVINSSSLLFSQTTIVEWNFPNNPDDSLADAGIPSNALKIISPVGTTGSITYPVGVTTQSISTTGWTGGQGTKNWMIEFSTSLYNQMTVSSRQQSSNTGPRDFKIQYRIGAGGIWTDLPGATSIIVANNFTSGIVNEVPLPVECDDQPSVFLRWIMVSDSSVNNGIVAGGGTSRIDDIVIESALNEPMPVELISFTGTVVEKSIVLNWQTATETNNFGFDIERMIRKQVQNDNLGWEKIGFVDGNGNSNSTANYVYEDRIVIAGQYSYRLKQIDFDGQYAYSNIVEVDLSKPNIFSLKQNYPNPFNPSTKIEYSIPLAETSHASSLHVSLKIFDVLGNEVMNLVNEVKPAGYYEIEFNAADLSSGVYYYRLSAGNFFEMKKMLMIK